MPSTVIVALPEADEDVWDLSSEKKPHLTLLYLNGPLGTNEEEIIQFVQHAANTSLSRFGLSVDRRGTLGEDDADVLFFDTEYGVPNLRTFRAQLLKHDEIAKNYVKAEQFPGWTPHLTMGYPESPAKEPDESQKYGLKWINFDRIAIWTSSFEGLEFDLPKHSLGMVDDVSWSEEHGVHIMHSGIKGMRWGVRKDGERGVVRRAATKAKVAVDASNKTITTGEKKLIFLPKAQRLQASARTQARVLSEAAAINGQPKFSGKDLKKNPTLKDEYFKAVETKAIQVYKEELTRARLDAMKEFISGSANESGVTINVKANTVQHSEETTEPILILDFELDDLGQISGVIERELDMEHSGVKGMRWGVRRPVGPDGRVKTSSTPRSEAALAKLSGKKKPTGPAHEDHVKAQEALKKSVESLSTKDLQELNNRIRSLQEYRKLTAQEKLNSRSQPKKIADWMLGINQPQKKGGNKGGGNKAEVAKLAAQILADLLKKKAAAASESSTSSSGSSSTEIDRRED